MNELEQIVQQMLDEGQPEENINAVIAEYQKSNPDSNEGKTNAVVEETVPAAAEKPVDMGLQSESGSLESQTPSTFVESELEKDFKVGFTSYEEANNIKEDQVPREDIYNIVRETLGDDLDGIEQNINMAFNGDQYIQKDFLQKVLTLKTPEIEEKKIELTKKYNLSEEDELQKANEELYSFQNDLIETAKATSNSYKNWTNTYREAYNNVVNEIIQRKELKAEEDLKEANEADVKIQIDNFFSNLRPLQAILPESMQRGFAKLGPMMGQAWESGFPVRGALNQFDEAVTFANKANSIKNGGYTTRKDGTIDVINIAGGINNYKDINAAVADFNLKSQEKLQKGAERFVASEKYQKEIEKFGASPTVLDGITGAEFGEIVATQAGQMGIAFFTVGTGIYGQEAGQILMDVVSEKAKEKYPDYEEKTPEERQKIILEIASNGEIDFSQIEKSGAAIATADFAASAFGLGKAAARPIGSLFRNLAQKNFKGALKAAKGDVRKVATATLFEIPTEMSQSGISMVEVESQLGRDKYLDGRKIFDIEQLKEAGAQAFVASGPLIGTGRVANRGIRHINRKVGLFGAGKMSLDVKEHEDAIKILYENGSISKTQRDNELTALYEAENLAENDRLVKDLEPEARSKMFDLVVEQKILENKNKEIINPLFQSDLSTVYGKGQVEKNKEKIKELQNERKKILALQTRLFMGDKLRQWFNSNPDKTNGFQYLSFNTTKEAKEYLEAKGVDITQENIAGLLDGKVYGTTIPKIKTIIDVKETAGKGELGVGANVVHHEGLHAIGQTLSDENFIKLSKEVGLTLQKSNDPILTAIGIEAQRRVDRDYSESSPREQAEEFFASISDYMRVYEINEEDVPTASNFSKLGAFFAKILQVEDLNTDLTDLESGAEVLAFLRKYNSFNGTPRLNLPSITPKRATEIAEEDKKTKAQKANASKIVENIVFEEGSINQQFQEYDYDGSKNNAPESFQAEAAMAYEPLAQAVVDRMSKIGIGKAGSKEQNQFIIDYLSDSQNREDIASDLVFGTDRNKASSLLGLAKTFDPEIGSFGGYAKGFLGARAIRVLDERLGGQVTQGAQTLDAPESKEIISETKEVRDDIRSVAEKLGLPKEILNKANKLAELASVKADKTLESKNVSDLKKINARNKAFNDLFGKQLFSDIANELGKNTKNSTDFSIYLNKNFQTLSDVALANIDFQKGSGPAALWNIDNPPSKEEFVDYYEAKDEKASTRADRKKSLNNAIARSLANEARIEFAKNDPATAQAFKEKHGVVLASKIVKPEDIRLQTLAGIPNFKEQSGMPAMNVWKGLNAETNIGFDLSTEGGRERAISAMETALTKGKVPINAFNTAEIIINSSPRFFVQQEKEYQNAKDNFGKNDKRTIQADKERKKVKNAFIKDMNTMLNKVKQNGEAVYLTEAAKDWTKNKYAFSTLGKTLDKIADSFVNGKVNENNLANLSMFEQTMKPLYNLVSEDPKMVNLVMMLTNTSNGGSNLWFRQGAEVVGYSKFLLPGKEGKRGIEWEHAMQANNARLFLLNSAINKVPWNTAYPAVKRNYKVIALDKSLDDILKASKRGNAMGEGWNVYTSHWTERYFHPDVFIQGGIDPTSIIDISGQTMADKYKIDAAGKSTRVMASKVLDKEFNDILQEVKGVKSEARYSEDRAKLLGKNKGRFKFFVPYSAEDFVGLIYPTLGKGKIGDKNFQWYKKNLLTPYAVAINQFEAAKVNTLKEWRQLKKQIKKSPKSLKKQAVRGFTNEQALRIFLWNEQNVVPETTSKTDTKALVNYVKNSPELLEFANSIKSLLNGNPYPAPESDWLAGNLTIDLINNINTVSRSEFLKDWQENVDTVYSKENLNKLQAIFGDKYVEALENILHRMKTGRNRIGGNRLEQEFLGWVNDSVGTIMFFNTRSALLQTISSVNFINFSDNNPLMAGKAFANQPQFWKDFATLMNSDFLKARRSGLKNDVNADEIANAASTSKNRIKGALSGLLKAGFLPTQIADNFAIAIGGASFYRNRINSYKKKGFSEQEAISKALIEFQEIAEESQQSSRPDRVSMQQASGLGRVILAFANTPMQYTRLVKKASLDLYNGRGDWKTNLSKIIYYGAVQNIIFTALQQALFASLFDDDVIDNEEEEDAIQTIANSTADMFLRGSGVYGAGAAAIKNLIIEAVEQYKSKTPNYVDVGLEALSLSPPIDRKISNLRNAGRAFTYKDNLKDIKSKGISIDNPAALALGQVLSAVANVPADRAILKARNIKMSLDQELETWQRISLALGYSDYNLDIEKDDQVQRSKEFQSFMKNLKKSNPDAYKRIIEARKKSPTKKLAKGVAGQANRDGTIEIDPNLSPVEKAKTIAHEKQHVKDIKSGMLDYDDNFVYWKGKKYKRKNGKILYNGKYYKEGDPRLPWEKRAYNAEPTTKQAKKLYA